MKMHLFNTIREQLLELGVNVSVSTNGIALSERRRGLGEGSPSWAGLCR